jgi:hypothetical protein
VTPSPWAHYTEIIERKPGDDPMSSYHHPDNLLDMGKAKMRRYHQETAALRLAQEARNFQPGLIRTAVNKLLSFFKSLLLKKDHPQPQACSKTATESM